MIDLTEKFDCEKAHALDKNVLILRKLDNPVKRFDGEKALYELEYRYLSKDVTNDKDESWVCVEGNDFTFWTVKEIKELGEISNLFEHFNLWG